MVRILITGGNGNLSKIIKNHLSNEHEIISLSRNEIDISNFKEVEDYFSKNTNFDILIHSAIVGGRRTKQENYDVVYKNLSMFENMIKFAHLFKLIINFDSGAIYDRETDIYNRDESDLLTIPKDYYGFSKYIIYKRSLSYDNLFNFRIFNIFHTNEEPDRFIKSCFISKLSNSPVTIFQDKYFDFMYEDDFVKIMRHYINNCNSTNNLVKTFNLSYKEKYKLSDIAKMILKNNSMIDIINPSLTNNYCGDSSQLDQMNIKLDGLEKSLQKYETKYNEAFDNFKYNITYGLRYVNIDITTILLSRFVKNNILHIPSQYYIIKNSLIDIPPEFINLTKSFFITDKLNNYTQEYDLNTQYIFIDLNTSVIYTNDIPEYIKNIFPNYNEPIPFNLKIKYGNGDNQIDVTNIVFCKCMKKNLIYIPCDTYYQQNRIYLFEHLKEMPYTEKHIYLYDKNDNLISVIDHNGHIYINTDTSEYFVRHQLLSYINNVPDYFKESSPENFI
jgi:nucleoside-diphosphate-sugar epimerase